MNYYERHLGDYARDTAHLSMLEHGAYSLLLDRYYSTEAGIPEEQAHRLARARTKEERAAVDAVLGEFFTLRGGVWINGRAEREVERAQTKIKAARENGKAGGRPKRNQKTTDEKPGGLLAGSVSETQSKALQTPDTRQENKSEPSDLPAQPARTLPNAEPPPEPPPEAPGHAPTAAGRVCKAMKAVGFSQVSPGDLRFTTMLEQGYTEAEFVGVAAEAVGGGKGWAWVLTVVQRRRSDAAAIAITPGLPPQQRGPAAPNATTTSDAAERTAEMLRQQSNRGHTAPPAALLARRRTAQETSA